MSTIAQRSLRVTCDYSSNTQYETKVCKALFRNLLKEQRGTKNSDVFTKDPSLVTSRVTPLYQRTRRQPDIETGVKCDVLFPCLSKFRGRRVTATSRFDELTSNLHPDIPL